MPIMTRVIALYLFDEIEVLDLGGPFEVFSTASRMKARLMPGFESGVIPRSGNRRAGESELTTVAC